MVNVLRVLLSEGLIVALGIRKTVFQLIDIFSSLLVGVLPLGGLLVILVFKILVFGLPLKELLRLLLDSFVEVLDLLLKLGRKIFD